MAFGKIKADAIIRDNNGTEEEVTMASLVAKAGLASPTFTGTVTLPGTTALAGQASDVTIVDNNAAALEIKEGSTAYVTFDTTDSNEQIEIAKKVELANHLEFSAAKDILIPDNQANALDIAEGANAYVTFDTTDNSEQIEVAKKVVLANHLEFSSAKDILIPDNDSAGLEIKEGTTSYMTFDTTNSAEQVEVNVPVVLNNTTELRLGDSDSSHYVAIKAPDTVSSNVVLKLPSTDGNADQVLKTNGSGVLDWVDAASGKLLKVTTLTNNTRTSVSTASYSRQPVAMLSMGNVTKTSNTSTLICWGHSSGSGQSSGGGDFYIQINTGVIDRAGSFTYPGGNYANHITWAGKYPYSLNAGTYAVTLGHHSQSSGNRPLNVINPNSGDHGNFSSSGNNGTGTTIFIMEFES